MTETTPLKGIIALDGSYLARAVAQRRLRGIRPRGQVRFTIPSMSEISYIARLHRIYRWVLTRPIDMTSSAGGLDWRENVKMGERFMKPDDVTLLQRLTRR